MIDSSKVRWRWLDLVMIVLPLACFYLLFWKTIGYPFLDWDDKVYVTNRGIFHQIARGELGLLWQFFSPAEVWRSGVVDFYPMRDLSYALDAWRGGVRANFFHATNLHIHALNIILVYIFARLLSYTSKIASFVALCFAVHPLAVEPVAWVSGRKEVLYVFWGTLSLLSFWIACRAKERWKRWLGRILFAVFFAFSLLTKGPAICFLLIAAWWMFLCPVKNRWKQWVFLLPVSVLAGYWVLWLIRWGQKVGDVVHVSEPFYALWFRALGAPSRAVASFFLPLGLSPDYGAWEVSWWADPHSWFVVVWLMAILLLFRRGFLFKAHYRILWILFGCVLLAVLPTSGIVRVGQIRADRFFYLATFFLSLGLGGLLMHLRDTKYLRIGALAALGFIGLLSWGTFEYRSAWRSDRALWAYAFQVQPKVARVNRMYGQIFRKEGDLNKARILLKRATHFEPKSAESWYELGMLWSKWVERSYRAKMSMSWQKAIPRAEKAFRKAVALKPELDFGYWSLGNLWHVHAMSGIALGEAKKESLQKAFQSYHEAFKIRPKRIVYIHHLGLIRMEQRKYKQAESYLRQALGLKRASFARRLLPIIVYDLCNVLWKQGRKKEAHRTLNKWQERFPSSHIFWRWQQKHPLPSSKPKKQDSPTTRKVGASSSKAQSTSRPTSQQVDMLKPF